MKVGDKYIIEIEEVIRRNGAPQIARIKGFNALVFDKYGLEKLEPYEGNWEEAYLKGYAAGYGDGKNADRPCIDTEELEKKAYDKGLNDAWECARKIYKMTVSEIITVFGGCSNWVDYSASEAIAKVREYKQDKPKNTLDDLWKNIKKWEIESHIDTLRNIIKVSDRSDCGIKEIDGTDEEAIMFAINVLEQMAEQEPYICDTCKHNDKEWDEEPCDGCCGNHSGYEPSEDLIRRQAVLETLDDMDNALDEDRTIENYKELLKECYEVLPPVNPQEPKTGHWIMPVQDDGMSDPMYYQVRCSKCGFDLDPQTWYEELHQYGADKYCPNCGARMISEKIYCTCTDEEMAKSFIEDVETVKDLLPQERSDKE